MLWAARSRQHDGRLRVGVAVDASGTPFVTGFATGPVEGQPFGSADAVLLKYGKGGVLRWVREFGTTEWDAGIGLTLYRDSAYIGGITNGDLNGVPTPARRMAS